MSVFVAPLHSYEKEDIVRRAITQEKEWENPFPDLDDYELKIAEKNLREILVDIRRAKFALRMKFEEEMRASRYLD